MISLFKHKDKKDKPVDYSKDPKYKGWEKVYKGAEKIQLNKEYQMTNIKNINNFMNKK